MNATVRYHNGAYLLYRKKGKGMRCPRTGQVGRPPQFRHPTRSAAVFEAERLLVLHPEATFLILREVGEVQAAAPSSEADNG